MLFDRYCNWLKVDLAVEEALRAKSTSWAAVPLTRPRAVGLITKAA